MSAPAKLPPWAELALLPLLNLLAALVLSGVDAGGANAIYTVGADGSHFQKIADGDLAFWSWK